LSPMDQALLADAIARARAGDREAWGEIYRRYAPAIFRFCRRVLPTREDAEDATTEIFMKLREKLIQYDPLRPFTSWLYKVAANHCWDLLRRRHIREDLETGEIENLPLQAPDPDQLSRLIAAHTSGQVRAALAKLPVRSQMALVLRYYAEMSYEEIADTLRLRPGVVGVVLLRARHQLRHALSTMGQTSSSAGGVP
jgi:RNA polymerase sigma-70 factor (ECF subfamily)